MSLKTVSNMIYQGDIADLPPLTAPMPRGGVYYADLVNSLFVSKPDSNFSKNRNYATAISFTRTTLASFISAAGNLEYAAINTPRIDRHPATRKILGMRVENSSTNYALNALDQTASNYTASGLSVSAPSNGWCTLTESSANEVHVLMDNQSTIDAALYNAVSVFAKAGTAQYLQIQVLGAGAQAFANFDVRNQKVTKMGRLAVRANIFQGFNDSLRCVLCVKGSGNTVGSVKYSLINDPLAEPDVAYVGTGRTMQVSQLQIEKNTYHSSSAYFPDGAVGGTASANRQADAARLLDIPAGVKSNFSVFVKGVMTPAPLGNAGGNILFSLLNNTALKYVGFGLGAADSSNAFQSLAAHNINAGSTLAGIPFTGKMFSQYGDYALMITLNNGVLKVYSGMTDTPETLLTGCPAFDYVMLGRNSSVSGSTVSNSGFWGGWLQKAVLFDSALSDADMIAQFELLV
ncbi:TPA: hypothetical protein RRJ31_000330 [Klebsiella pneumoniae]|nr:hypothetical protein [Klebsiella pneumoniae]